MNSLSSESAFTVPSEPSAAMPLDTLIVAFESALENEDWAQIAILNEATRSSVEVEMASAKDQGIDAMSRIQPQMEVLSVLYQKMQFLCANERDKVGAQLNEIGAGRSGIKQYDSMAKL